MKHVFAVAFVLALSASPVLAQFMKPGASPEAGVAGVWRVIGASRAPWAQATTKERFPLLKHAIEFANGTVKGPSPLACADARFSSGVTSQADLFEGKLRGEESAMALHLTNSSVTTYRVICEGASRDYYIDDNAALVVSAGEAVYTLERPTGMNPEQYQAGFSGPSFDCAKAKSAIEHAICRDAALSKADRKLNDAYQRLKASETPQSSATVQRAQRDWLAYVAKSCATGRSTEAEDPQTLQECLDDHLSDRADRLDAVRVVKAGALVLEPRMRVLTRAKPETEESDIYPWMSGGTEASAFNAYVAKELALDKRRMDDTDLFPFGNDVGDLKLYARRTYSVARFDSRVVSLQVSTFDYTGGAHEAIGEKSINWDLANKKPFALNDVFAEDKPWRKFVVDSCIRELHEEFAAQQAPDPDRSAIESVVTDGDNWLWGPDSATVHFTVYAIASFSGGEFDVDIPYEALKPYFRSNAPPISRSTDAP